MTRKHCPGDQHGQAGRSTSSRRGVALLLALALAQTVAAAARAADRVDVVPRARPRFYQDRVYVRVRPRDAADLERIWNLAEDVVAPHDPALVEHDVVVTRDTLGRLQAAGLDAQIVNVDVQGWIDSSVDRAVRPALSAAGAFGPFFSKVQELDAITAYLHELEQASGGRASLRVIGKSIEQRDLLALRISSAPPGAERPSVVVIGTHHAREWASPMVAMGVVDALVRRYDDDPRVRRVVDGLEIFVIPVANPDGYVATFNGMRLQRKNMDPRCNVDLNRNYDAAFGTGVGGDCLSDTYPGPAAFSEPETRAVRDLVASLAHPRLLIDYHSTAAVVMIPFAYTQSPPPQLDENKTLCQLYSSSLRAVRGTNYPAVPGYTIAHGAGGGAFDWFRTRYGHTIVVELGGGGGPGGFDLPAASVVPFVEENLAGWLAVAEKLLEGETADGGATEDAATSSDGPDAPALTVDAGAPSGGEEPDAGPPPVAPDGVLRRKVQADHGCAYARGPATTPLFLAAIAPLALFGRYRLRRPKST
jgi:murein tripeptide amidase MpaA